MKLVYLFPFLLLLFPFKVNAQAKDRSLGEIDALVAQIKSRQQNYEKIENEKDGASYRCSYFEGKQLQFVSVQDSGKILKRVDWYFEGDHLIHTETSWLDASGSVLFVEKTYHNRQGLIAWIRSESSFVDSNSSEFIKLDKELSAYAQQLREDALK